MDTPTHYRDYIDNNAVRRSWVQTLPYLNSQWAVKRILRRTTDKLKNATLKEAKEHKHTLTRITNAAKAHAGFLWGHIPYRTEGCRNRGMHLRGTPGARRVFILRRTSRRAHQNDGRIAAHAKTTNAKAHASSDEHLGARARQKDEHLSAHQNDERVAAHTKKRRTLRRAQRTTNT